MLIPCPFCGPRDAREFDYQGDAAAVRPDPETASPDDWHTYVYERRNPKGRHREVWQHAHGCRHFLAVERDTETHEVHGAELLGPWAGRSQGPAR